MRSLFLDHASRNAGRSRSPIRGDRAQEPVGVCRALEPPAYLAKDAFPLSGYFLHSPDHAYILLNLDAANGAHPFAPVYHEYTHFALRKAEWLAAVAL